MGMAEGKIKRVASLLNCVPKYLSAHCFCRVLASDARCVGAAFAVCRFFFKAPSGTPRKMRQMAIRRAPPFARFSTP